MFLNKIIIYVFLKKNWIAVYIAKELGVEYGARTDSTLGNAGAEAKRSYMSSENKYLG